MNEYSLFNGQSRLYNISLYITLESIKKGPINDVTVRVTISPNPLDKDPYLLLIRRAALHRKAETYEFPGGKNKKEENIVINAFREAKKINRNHT